MNENGYHSRMLIMATELELSSFLTKFKQLCSAGYEATLVLKSTNGQASVSLDVKLGTVESSSINAPSTGVSSAFKPRRKRSPAYHRRQELRRNVRKSVHEAAAKVADDDMNKIDVGQISTNIVCEADTKVLEVNIDQAEESLDSEIEDDNMNDKEYDLSEELNNLIMESKRKRDNWEKRKTGEFKAFSVEDDSGVS